MSIDRVAFVDDEHTFTSRSLAGPNPNCRLHPDGDSLKYDAINASIWEADAGFTRRVSNPASRLRCRSACEPDPVNATKIMALPHDCRRMCVATSYPLS